MAFRDFTAAAVAAALGGAAFVSPVQAGPGDPSATFIAGNAAPGETTSTNCLPNGYLEVVFSLGGAVVSRIESGTTCTPGSGSGSGSSSSRGFDDDLFTAGWDSDDVEVTFSFGEEAAVQKQTEKNQDVFVEFGGADTPSASEFEQQYALSELEDGDGISEEDGDRYELESEDEGRVETVTTEIEPDLPPVTAGEKQAGDRFVARVNALIEAEAAFEASEQAVADAEALLEKIRKGAQQDLANDLYNFGVGQVTGLLTGKSLDKLLGEDPPDGWKTNLTTALVEELGGQVAGLAEAETPEEVAGLLANRAGEGAADAFIAGMNAALGNMSDANPSLKPIAKLTGAAMDLSKIAAKGAVSLAQVKMLEDAAATARRNLAQNHAGAVGNALRVMFSNEGAAVLEGQADQQSNFSSFVANHETATTEDVSRYAEIQSAYAPAQAAAQQLVAIAKDHVAKAEGSTLRSGVQANLSQTQARGGEGGTAAAAFEAEAFGGAGPSGSSTETRIQAAFDEAAARFGSPESAQFEALGIKDTDIEYVWVEDQAAPRSEASLPSNVAFVGNVRVYTDIGADAARDRRGGSNANRFSVSVSAGADARVTEAVVAGMAVRVSIEDEDDDAFLFHAEERSVTLTPYATLEASDSLYFDAYALVGWGRIDAEATDGTGETADTDTRQWAFGLGANWREQFSARTRGDFRFGAGVARSTSEALFLNSRPLRPKSGTTSTSLSARGKLAHQVGALSVQPAAQLTYQTGSLSRTATRWRLRPEFGVEYRPTSMEGFSFGAKAYHDLLQPDLRSYGASLSLAYSF